MNIEVGFYRTAEGEKVEILAKRGDWWVGVFYDEQGPAHYHSGMWKDNGTNANSIERGRDIVSKWRDPCPISAKKGHRMLNDDEVVTPGDWAWRRSFGDDWRPVADTAPCLGLTASTIDGRWASEGTHYYCRPVQITWEKTDTVRMDIKWERKYVSSVGTEEWRPEENL